MVPLHYHDSLSPWPMHKHAVISRHYTLSDGTKPLYLEIRAEWRWNKATLPGDPGGMTMEQSHSIQMNEQNILFHDRMNNKFQFLWLFKHETQVEINYLHFWKVSLIKCLGWRKSFVACDNNKTCETIHGSGFEFKHKLQSAVQAKQALAFPCTRTMDSTFFGATLRI